MPLINYVKSYGADVAKVLESDERLIDMGLYREPLIGDESRLARTVDELSPRMRQHVEEHGQVPSGPDKFFQGFDPLAGGVQVSPNPINRLMGGVSGEGGTDSTAGRLWRAANSRDKGASTYYAVTDRRLLLLTERKLNSGEFEIVFELPRSAVASAARKGKLLFQRGRVEVRFTDGSMKAWTAGMLSAARARSLVAAMFGPIRRTEA